MRGIPFIRRHYIYNTLNGTDDRHGTTDREHSIESME